MVFYAKKQRKAGIPWLITVHYGKPWNNATFPNMPWLTKELTSTLSISSGKIRTSQSLPLKNCAISLLGTMWTSSLFPPKSRVPISVLQNNSIFPSFLHLILHLKSSWSPHMTAHFLQLLTGSLLFLRYFMGSDPERLFSISFTRTISQKS